MFGIEKPILLNIELEDKAILQQDHHTTSMVDSTVLLTNYTFHIF